MIFFVMILDSPSMAVKLNLTDELEGNARKLLSVMCGLLCEFFELIRSTLPSIYWLLVIYYFFA